MTSKPLNTRAPTLLAALGTGPVIAVILMSATAAAQTDVIDAATLEEMRRLIEQQHAQLQRQADQLDAQTGVIGALESRLDQLERQSAAAQSTATQAQSTAKQAIDTAERVTRGELPDTVVTSGNDKIKLAISGQTNRAFNAVDDGESTDAYFVDNDTSNTRVRFVGTAQVSEETTMGTTVEVALSPDNSFDVSQENESSDDFTDLRKAEAFVRNDRYGQLSFGKGSAAADDTAEYDLSLVAGPIMYSGVSDIVGGIRFTDGDALTGIAVGSAFFNFDGNRQSRIRYDSPVFGPGLQLSVSAGSDDRYDAAITWGGDYGDWTGVDIGSFTTLGALSIRDPNEDNVDYRLAGSFSALHNPSGLSFTVAGGMDKLDGDGDDPYNLYGKLGWDTSIFSYGPTGFGVDVTYSENISGDGDKGFSSGFAAVQVLDSYGTEIYAQFRTFDLDRGEGPDLEDVYAGTIGARVKF